MHYFLDGGDCIGKTLNMNLLHLFFDASNMHRWNDHIRPFDFTELDKQAHKAFIAWVLGKCYELSSKKKVDWVKLIKNGMFSFMERCVMTDIKPPLFHRIKAEKKKEVAEYVYNEIEKTVKNLDENFLKELNDYLHSEEKCIENSILSAAHYMATQWEFGLVYDANSRTFGINATKDEIEKEIENHSAVIDNLKDYEGIKSLISIIGQLRFQERWTRTPRIPKTTVLGHSILVANMVFLHNLDRNQDDRTIYNNYYSALFHDLPEVLTKDVITPVKTNVGGLSEILDAYEKEMIEKKIIPLIPKEWAEEFRFLVYNPFDEKNNEQFGIVSGKDIKAADMLAAYMESRLSRYYGVTSKVLNEAEKTSVEKLKKFKCSITLTQLIEDLEQFCKN